MKPFLVLPAGLLAAVLLAASPGPLHAHADEDTPTPPPTATPTPPPTATPTPSPTATPAGDGARVETVVCIRHGEKPDNDEGQLTAQGFNRALALPDVLISRYGAAQFIYAPMPTKKPASKGSGNPPGTTFSYIRPIVTIEPTAIRLGLPVDTKFDHDETAALQSEICTPAYQSATVFIAWEHHDMERFVRKLVDTFGGNVQDIPKEWPGDDFDSIYVVRIRTEGGRRTAFFAHDQEKLNGLSRELPSVTPVPPTPAPAP